jgi:hypothetical protein
MDEQKRHYISEPVKKKKKYKTVADHRMMGLNNKICHSPVGFCHLKKVYIDETQSLKCLYRPDFRGYETSVCRHYEGGI